MDEDLDGPVDRTAQLGLFESPAERGPVDSGPPGTRRVGDAIAVYLVLLGSLKRSAHSIKAARLDLEGLARHLGDPPLAAVTADQLRGFVARLHTCV